MKRLGGVWTQLTSFENLYLAYRQARRGKGDRDSVTHFALNLEAELFDLQAQLQAGEYWPGEYRLFTIYERKPRQIAAAPFCDRVVHHALMNVVEPALDKTFIFDSYACRKGKGVHAAVDRYQGWAQRYRYALKLDVEKYFPSVDRLRLKEKLERRIKDRPVLDLFARIIDTAPAGQAPIRWYPGDDLLTPLERSRGIPIGNLTSQIMANLYLDDLDHFIKHELKAPAYLRYVDDLVLLGDDKRVLADWKIAISERLARDRLRFHPNKAHILPTSNGVSLLGYVVWPSHRKLRGDNVRRFSKRLRGFARAFAAGRMNWSDFNPSVQSWLGHAGHADTQALRRAIFSGTVFRRGASH